jgi:two-component system alkaline phosphatase synthesis response regulator PhoP
MAKPPLARILIVEDDGELLEVLKYVLEEAGYATYSAGDGAQALELAESEPIDLVILDISMSGMSGIDVARSLRSHPATSNILIAIHTGLPEEDVRAQLPDVDCFMPKGDDANSLVRMVSELLGSRASVEASGVLS